VSGDEGDAAILSASLAVFLWGVGPLIVRGISASSPTIVAYRLVFAIPVMFVVAYATGGRVDTRLLRLAAAPGALFGISIITGFASFQETSIANATLIGALSPALVLVVAAKWFDERISRRQLVLSAGSFAGVALVVLASSGSSDAALRGDLLAVASLVVFSGYFLLVKRRRDAGVHTWSFIAAVMAVAACVAVPWALLVADDLAAVGGRDWVLIFAAIIGPGLLGHGLMTRSQKHLDVSFASLLTLGSPVVSTLGAWLVFAQSMRPLQILGAGVVLGCLAGVVLDARHVRVRAGV
jgi:drug/metabolite transporter (DMT)-like permease